MLKEYNRMIHYMTVPPLPNNEFWKKALRYQFIYSVLGLVFGLI